MKGKRKELYFLCFFENLSALLHLWREGDCVTSEQRTLSFLVADVGVGAMLQEILNTGDMSSVCSQEKGGLVYGATSVHHVRKTYGEKERTNLIKLFFTLLPVLDSSVLLI